MSESTSYFRLHRYIKAIIAASMAAMVLILGLLACSEIAIAGAATPSVPLKLERFVNIIPYSGENYLCRFKFLSNSL